MGCEGQGKREGRGEKRSDDHTYASAGVLVRATASGKKDGHDGAVQTKRLGEDEDEHHGDVHAGLLRNSTHTRVTSDTDRHARSNTTETDSQTGRKVKEAGQKAVAELDCCWGKKHMKTKSCEWAEEKRENTIDKRWATIMMLMMMP